MGIPGYWVYHPIDPDRHFVLKSLQITAIPANELHLKGNGPAGSCYPLLDLISHLDQKIESTDESSSRAMEGFRETVPCSS